MLGDFGRILHQSGMNFRRLINLFRVSFFTELNDSRPSVERRLPIIKKVLWQSQQHLQEGFQPMGVLDRVLCPGAFLSYNPARGAPEPMIHGPRPTTPTNNKNVPSLIRPGGMRACALNSCNEQFACEIRSLGRFGLFSAPFRAQVGSRTLPGIRGRGLLEPFWPKMGLPGVIFETRLDPKWFQNRTFEGRSAL